MRFRVQISYQRLYFWLASTLFYWLMDYLAHPAARSRAFLAVEALGHLAEREGFGSVMNNMAAIEGEAWLSMASASPAPGGYALVTALRAIVLIAVPFVVRLDNKEPLRGAVLLPVSIFLAYFYASMLNIVISAGLCWAISLYSGHGVGPDALAYMMNPLYLFAPRLMGSAIGTLSQCLYLAYIYSVLSMPDKVPEEITDQMAEELEEESTEEWNKTACTMEMDRLTRLIDAKVQSPALVEDIRKSLSDYINKSHSVHEDLKGGVPHYKVILIQAAACLRREIAESPQNAAAGTAFLFVADEMEKMEYVTPPERETMSAWLAKTTAENPQPDPPAPSAQSDSPVQQA
ncbi:MAG: hypothetical protein LBL73_08210 [Synergistaceae bacterium]|jgi:hypothetical protein|nr:hypothetical protein [Synergistaceae bacterium]